MGKKYKIFILFITITLIHLQIQVYAQEWVVAGSVPNPGLTPSISVVDANIAWIAGGTTNLPLIFNTVNGGDKWDQVTTNGTSNELHCIWAINPTTAIVGEGAINSFARLYKFAPEGSVWNIVLQTGQNDGAFNNLVFSRINPLVGGALSDGIYITTNGGNSWVIKHTGVVGVSAAQNSLMLIDENFFGFGLKNGASRVRMTTDGGNTWSTKNINLTGTYTSGFAFRDDKLFGIASTSESMPYIARTTDGGNTWTTVNIGTGLSGITIIKWIPGTNVVYILGSNGAIKRSINNGLNWTSMQTAGITGLNHFDFKNVNNIICGYAVSSNGSVIKLADSILLITNKNPNASNVSSEFRLYQNYPNPFNPTTQIKYSITTKSPVTIKIFDAPGRIITTLVNETQSPGIYTVNWNAGTRTTGVYFYRIETGNYKDTKKMVLIK